MIGVVFARKGINASHTYLKSQPNSLLTRITRCVMIIITQRVILTKLVTDHYQEENMSTQTNETPDNTNPSTTSDFSRKLMLAVQEELDHFIKRMVERGEIAEQEARSALKEVVDHREKLEVEKQAEQQNRAEPAANAEVEVLQARIAELSKKIEEMKKESVQ
jgi:polyhydroxyalkanoate synthesis regulator phasin